MSRFDRIPRLYAIADAEALAPRSLADGAVALARAGVGWIQLRGKGLSDAELFRQVERACRELAGEAARLWVNDRPDLAALLPVAGVHLGQDDLPPRAARAVVGDGVWIGRSTHDLRQVEAAAADPAVDVVAVGPVFATASKRDAEPVVGLDLVRAARAATDKPLVAIGGIDAGRAPAVLRAGADAVAVLGAICSGDLSENARRLLQACRAAGGLSGEGA